MKKNIFSVILFVIPFLFISSAIVIYFKITTTVSQIKMPILPAVSFKDLVKFSRFSLEKAPSESLVGSVSSMSGEIKYEDRTATESAVITSPPAEVQQGESFSTGQNGNISVKFDGGANFDMQPNSSVAIVQTLPKDIVFSQTEGKVTYEKVGSISVSIRSMHLLVENGGKVEISIDKIKPILTIKVLVGYATFAYNDIDNISRILTLAQGKTLIFNDRTRRAVTI